jgi:hypothetical protein
VTGKKVYKPFSVETPECSESPKGEGVGCFGPRGPGSAHRPRDPHQSGWAPTGSTPPARERGASLGNTFFDQKPQTVFRETFFATGIKNLFSLEQ